MVKTNWSLFCEFSRGTTSICILYLIIEKNAYAVINFIAGFHPFSEKFHFMSSNFAETKQRT